MVQEVQDRITLLSSVKALAHVEEDETAYDDEIELLIQNAVVRMKMAGVQSAILGQDDKGEIVTVGSFKVGSIKVGELIVQKAILGQDDKGEIVTVGSFKVGSIKVGEFIVQKYSYTTALEYIATIVKMGLYQDGTGAYYDTLSDIAKELLTTMYYAADDSDDSSENDK